MIVAGLMRGGPCNCQARAPASFSTRYRANILDQKGNIHLFVKLE